MSKGRWDQPLAPAALVGLALAALGSGCATLNEAECRQADWRLVGYEDGSAGRPADYVGRHREACARHGVTPALAAYRAGRREGLNHYCRGANGFRLGERGADYAGVCPTPLEADFLSGYEAGLRLHRLGEEVADARRQLRRLERERERLDREEQDARERLVNGDPDREERADLLADVVAARDRRPGLDQAVREARERLDWLHLQLQEARARSPYRGGP